MNTKLKVLAALTGVVLLSACAADPGSPEARYKAYQEAQEAKQEALKESVDNLPDWFVEPPQSNLAVYTVGFGSSTSLDMALTKATMSAKRGLADRTAGELSEVIREFATNVGSTNDPTVFEELERATKNVIRKTPVYGYRVSKKQINVGFGGVYQAYILLEYGDEEINKVLKRVLASQQLVERDSRKKAIYKLLEKEVQ